MCMICLWAVIRFWSNFGLSKLLNISVGEGQPPGSTEKYDMTSRCKNMKAIEHSDESKSTYSGLGIKLRAPTTRQAERAAVRLLIGSKISQNDV